VRLSRWALWGALVVLLALVPDAGARSATLKNAARLRSGPSAASTLIEMLPAGVSVEIVGQSAGWRQVELADGRDGYIWGEHLEEGEAGTAPPPVAEARTDTDVAAMAPRPLPEEIRTLREEVATLRQRPEPASAADMEKMRAQLEQLSESQRDVARWLDEHGAAGTPVVSDVIPTTSWLFLAAGLVIGWTLSRVTGRRERRQRIRL